MKALPTYLRQLTETPGGGKAALDEVVPLVYSELRRLARVYLKQERPGHTLQSSALVNEAYLRLVAYPGFKCEGRIQFFAIAARVMRHVLVDHARTRNYSKHGGNAVRVSLDRAAILSDEASPDIVALEHALTSLEAIDKRKSQIVELRYFGGLSIEETASVMRISSVTVQREWRWAKAYLHREILKGGHGGI